MCDASLFGVELCFLNSTFTLRFAAVWFSLASVIVLWDALFLFLRPRSMPGGDLHFIWKPCVWLFHVCLSH